MMERKLIFAVLSVVEEIPPGKVAAYGQAATFPGGGQNSQYVPVVRRIPLPPGCQPYQENCAWMVRTAGTSLSGRSVA